jgi:exodeoxyribonuclease-5
MLSAKAAKNGALVSENSLLKDLYNHIKSYSPNNKIVFVGDSYQLSPIGYNDVAPALRKKFLEEHFTNKIMIFRLTEILRQDKESQILTIAQIIKEKIDNGLSTFNLSLPNRFENYSSFINNFSKKYDSYNLTKSIALGWSRKNVLKMNLDFRNHYYSGTPSVFEVGDILYLNSRWISGFHEINKGEIGKVLEIINEDGIKGGMLYHTLKIEFLDGNNVPFTISTKVLSDYAYSETEFIPKEMFIKLAIERSKENKLFKKTGDAKDDEYVNAMQFKFAYALTVHKAQGGEWDHVFLHANTNWSDLRWNYTAVTRAAKEIYSYNK